MLLVAVAAEGEKNRHRHHGISFFFYLIFIFFFQSQFILRPVEKSVGRTNDEFFTATSGFPDTSCHREAQAPWLWAVGHAQAAGACGSWVGGTRRAPVAPRQMAASDHVPVTAGQTWCWLVTQGALRWRVPVLR